MDVGGGDPARPEDRDELRAHLRRRGVEIAERIRQLNERGRELADEPARGPTPDELAQAHECLVQAHAHAREAHLRAAERHDQATEAHLRAAELLAAHGRADLAERHRAAAGADRAAGEADRAAAAAEGSPGPSPPPEPPTHLGCGAVGETSGGGRER